MEWIIGQRTPGQECRPIKLGLANIEMRTQEIGHNLGKHPPLATRNNRCIGAAGSPCRAVLKENAHSVSSERTRCVDRE